MAGARIKAEILAQLEKLPPHSQKRLLELARGISPRGVAGKRLVRFRSQISRADLKRISEAIEESCEKVEPGEW